MLGLSTLAKGFVSEMTGLSGLIDDRLCSAGRGGCRVCLLRSGQLSQYGPVASMVPSPVWSRRQYGPVASMVSSPVWSRRQYGPVASMVLSPVWSRRQYGPVASMVPSPVWSCRQYGPVASMVPSPAWSCRQYGPVASMVLSPVWSCRPFIVLRCVLPAADGIVPVIGHSAEPVPALTSTPR